MSRTVAVTAAIVLSALVRPLRRLSRVGAMGDGAMTCLASGHCAAIWLAKKAAIAFFEQSPRSLVTTEWPV